MAIKFSKLRDPKLGLLDKITFGKLKDCRVCDVIQDHYEYLIWCEKQGFVQFQQIVIETIQDQANFKKWEAPKVYPDSFDMINGYDMSLPQENDWEDDVPF